MEKLEREFAAQLGVRGAVATGFGRSALRLALEATCAGSAVLVPDFICAQVPEAVRIAGGRPVFYRVPRNLAISAKDLAVASTASPAAVVVPHYFGRVQPHIAELVTWCRARAVVLIEDCALTLGAALNGRRAGSFGDLGVFSFTKSDWCYGGGMLATNKEDWIAEARAIREQRFAGAGKLAMLYGRLRRADFACNRPLRVVAAERLGRRLERDAELTEGNFYDAGRFGVAMPAFTARRASRILHGLKVDCEQRRRIVESLRARLERVASILFQSDDEPGDTGAFLLLQSRAGRARGWVEQAAKERVTLRHAWPAYQEPQRGQGSGELEWLADHLLILEIHPSLTSREVSRIAACLQRLAAME